MEIIFVETKETERMEHSVNTLLGGRGSVTQREPAAAVVERHEDKFRTRPLNVKSGMGVPNYVGGKALTLVCVTFARQHAYAHTHAQLTMRYSAQIER
jgi:hypothetical protein